MQIARWAKVGLAQSGWDLTGVPEPAKSYTAISAQAVGETIALFR